MTKMLTLFGEDIYKLLYNDLKRERAVQAYLLLHAKRRLEREEYYRSQRTYDTLRGRDKIDILDTYVTELESFVKEIDDLLKKRLEPESNYIIKPYTKATITAANKVKLRKNSAERKRNFDRSHAMERDSMFVSWDKEKFMLIASDRGYQTENALISDIAEALKLDRSGAKVLMEKGRFTWGQVILLGALFDMTPKEFCDTFLSGYFVEANGEYRASTENMDVDALLRTPIRPATEAMQEDE